MLALLKKKKKNLFWFKNIDNLNRMIIADPYHFQSAFDGLKHMYGKIV